MRILVVEDDKIISHALLISLKMEGHATDLVRTKEDASLALLTHDYGMLLLDIGLPDGSGFDLLSEIRNKGNSVPVIIMTAYDALTYKLRGFDSGADDYLIKPFKLEELNARVRAIKRRAEGKSIPFLEAGDITLFPSTKIVKKSGCLVNLGSREFLVLQVLMEKEGEIISKAAIEDTLYGWDMEIESNTVEVYIYRIRKILGKSSIETVRYEGYRMNLYA